MDFSDREREVLDLLSRGLSNQEIGRQLFLDVETVQSHNKSIFRKLGVRNRVEAATWGQANGYGQSQDSTESPDSNESSASSLPFHRLGARQYQIVGLVAQGKTNQEIGDELGISRLTVKSALAQTGSILGESDRNKIALAYNARPESPS